ncbi:MAG TPA: ATP-binding cassette domain-containing protein, partial [Kiloniellales bacterium]|nr:ATP-binding cassette domain-containing protein [Kiloniellales bacterium]
PTPRPLPPGGTIAFEGVRFAYAADQRAVLEGLDLEMADGERLAIVGESGSGKSTIARLLLRLWDPEAGIVRLAGADLRSVRQADIHARIAVLSQDTPIFSGSVRENLLIGKPEAGEEELWQALRDAGLADFIASLPDGLDAWVGETGVNLSGGQGRRLALARALLKPASILLLDEPTQGLDEAAQRAFFSTLRSAAQGRTVLLITHATGLEDSFDRILRLDQGRLQKVRN